MQILRAMFDVRLPDVVDILLVAVALHFVLAGLRRVRIRSLARIMLGLGVLYVVAQLFGLRLTVFLFNVLAAVVGLALAIMYHQELRSVLERIVRLLTRPARPRQAEPAAGEVPSWIGPLNDALWQMSSRKIGALVVLPGRDDLARHLSGGSWLDGLVSEPLLLSVFDPNSIGHDGAVVIEGDRITRFQAHLPLSADFQQLHQRGTRHAAALGLAERSDAMCLVVSEERGTISVAHDGSLRQVEDAAELRRVVEEYVRGVGWTAPVAPSMWSWGQIRLKLSALLIAYALWFVFAHEAATEYRSWVVPIEFTGLEEGLHVAGAEPPQAKVILSGPRRAFYFVDAGDIGIRATLFDLGAGQHEITLTASDVVRPDNLVFANIFPRTVVLRIEGAASEPAP